MKVLQEALDKIKAENMKLSAMKGANPLVSVKPLETLADKNSTAGEAIVNGITTHPSPSTSLGLADNQPGQETAIAQASETGEKDDDQSTQD